MPSRPSVGGCRAQQFLPSASNQIGNTGGGHKPPEWLDCRRSGDKQLFITVQFCECQKKIVLSVRLRMHFLAFGNI
ncbi:hypothetical protein niasHT_033205 [Heterodera trifolii]|uniref:Uncharacterized protein n=1 Tax=Heterodera trifolii TaxID=157864 RepID=A0ABD2I133_9BILA